MAQNNQHKYPEEILYTQRYKDELPMECLMVNYPELITNRRILPDTEGNYWQYDAEGKKILTDKALVEGTVTHLSVNLLGGFFKDEYYKFNPLAPIEGQKWNKLGNLPTEGVNYEYIKDSEMIYFYVNDINGITFPCNSEPANYEEYQKQLETINRNIKKYNLPEQQEWFGEFHKPGEKVKSHFIILVHHHPTNMNYWHIQFDQVTLHNNEDADEKNLKPKEFKRIKSKFRGLLFEKLKWANEVTLNTIIDKQYFLNKP